MKHIFDYLYQFIDNGSGQRPAPVRESEKQRTKPYIQIGGYTTDLRTKKITAYMKNDPQIEKFTIRVYGIWIKDDHILLSKERINDFSFIQFPGGGVEPGEGILEALKREWIEETGVKIEKYQHFYTTDFLQINAFNAMEQLISIYYKVNCLTNPLFYEKDESTPEQVKKLELTWQSLTDFSPDLLTFEDDKKICEMILDHH